MQKSSDIQIDKSLRQRIEAFARASGLSESEVVRRAFEQFAGSRERRDRTGYADNGESLLQRWTRLGFIGCIKGNSDSPADLSTDPKHLDGFGRA